MAYKAEFTVQEIIDEIKDKREMKVSQSSIAEALGVSKQYIGQLKDKPLPSKYIPLLESYYAIQFTGVDDSVCINYYPEVFGSCGTGVFVLSERKETMSVSTKFIESYTPSKQYSVINAYGDSMEPTIKNQDLLVVEHYDNEQIIDNQVYVFRYGENIFIKRLVLNINQLIIKSDNKEYDPIKLTLDNNTDIQIIGRIRGLLRGSV